MNNGRIPGTRRASLEPPKLPEGMTCADCAHCRRCVRLGCSNPGATVCDYAPRRFVERRTSGQSPLAEQVEAVRAAMKEHPLVLRGGRWIAEGEPRRLIEATAEGQFADGFTTIVIRIGNCGVLAAIRTADAAQALDLINQAEARLAACQAAAECLEELRDPCLSVDKERKLAKTRAMLAAAIGKKIHHGDTESTEPTERTKP